MRTLLWQSDKLVRSNSSFWCDVYLERVHGYLPIPQYHDRRQSCSRDNGFCIHPPLECQGRRLYYIALAASLWPSCSANQIWRCSQPIASVARTAAPPLVVSYRSLARPASKWSSATLDVLRQDFQPLRSLLSNPSTETGEWAVIRRQRRSAWAPVATSSARRG